MSARKLSSDTFANRPFKNLKNLLVEKEKKRCTEPPVAKKEEVPGDEELFARAMKEVKEIKEFREIPVYHNVSTYSRCRRSPDHDALKALEELVQGKRPVHLPDTPEFVEWIHEDYRDDLAQRLHEGHFSVQDCLDLHGNTVQEAKEEVSYFIKMSITKGYRCIKIIHGRGLRSPQGPVLKNSVVQWLLTTFRKYIAAFVTARQCDGGAGALYILFK